MKSIGVDTRKIFSMLVLITVIVLSLAGSSWKNSSAQGTKVEEDSSTQQVTGSSTVDVISPYFSVEHKTLNDGTGLEGYIINGPSRPLPEYKSERLASMASEVNGTVLPNFPSYSWVFGCSAVSGSMIAAYYDSLNFPNMYSGPTNGGVMPITDTSWPLWSDGSVAYPNNPLVASHDGVDGRTGRGSIDDYWVQYESAANDPYITNGWQQHTWGSAIGDYMKTSQSAAPYNNVDGATKFYSFNSSPDKLTCANMESYGINDQDGTYGRKLFYEARGYSVSDCYNQKTDNNGGGFTLANFQAEINAGNPVLLNLAGHSIVGYGYSDSTIYIRDTWDSDPGTTYFMPWGGSYEGMQLLSVSVVHPIAPHPTKVLFLPLVRKNVNQAPTNLLLSNTTIEENKPINTVIGTLSSVDPDNGDTFTYTLVPGAGDTGNGSFNISGNQLRSSVMFDYETQNSYSIRLRTTDKGGLYFEKVFSISILKTVQDPILNGNFEQGPVSWTEFSTHSWELITQVFPSGVAPHDGAWAVWLGGDYDEIAYIQQQVTIPANLTYLHYWHWIASADSCGNDFGGVLVNGTVVEVYNLCSVNNTGGWVQRVVNLSAYTGQTVTIQIRAETNPTLNSNLFIDQVSLQASGEVSNLPPELVVVFGADQTKADILAK